MSDIDQEGPLNNEWFNSESNLSGISSVDSTATMGVSVSAPSASCHIKALEIGNSNTTGPAPNTGMPAGYAPQVGTGPNKGESFLDTLHPNPPRSKSPSPISFHCGYAMGRGRGMGREGGKGSSTLVSEAVGLISRPVEIGSPFLIRFFVGRETHPSYVESTDDSPYYASWCNRIPATNRNDSGNDKVTDMLELIAKRLDNLENNRYFPSHELDHISRINADREVSSATLAASQSTEISTIISTAISSAISTAISTLISTVSNMSIIPVTTQPIPVVSVSFPELVSILKCSDNEVSAPSSASEGVTVETVDKSVKFRLNLNLTLFF